MGSIFPRKGTTKLYAKLKAVDGTWKQVPTGFSVGQESEAEKWLDGMERKVEAQRVALGPDSGALLTVTLYAGRWLDRRKTATVGDDRARITKHVLPRIGSMLLSDVRPRHIRDVILELRNAGELAPATIRNISGVLHTMFKSAVIEELIPSNPVVLERGTLPKKLDKDPSWRRQAIYTRAEIEQLLSSPLIPIDRRMFYALKFFAGRHSEVSRLTWSQYDSAAKPLGALSLDQTKTKVPRQVPVHPTLAEMLRKWKTVGWEDLYGHKPGPMDLIVPTRNLTERDANESQEQLKADLETIGLRVKAGEKRFRRGHDLRRTLITLARTDGAIDSMLRWITHGPKPSEILDTYSTPPWESLCAEISKLKIEVRDGKLIELPMPIAVGAELAPDVSDGAAMVQRSKVRASADEIGRPGRDSKESSGGPEITRAESSQEVIPIGSRSRATAVTPTAPRLGATEPDIAGVALDCMRERWRAERDARALRRDLLRLLSDLDPD